MKWILFCAFEHLATALKRPLEIRSLLVQCKLHGKALDVISVKAAVQRSYELVPEAYRQKFRGNRKNADHMELAREKGESFP